MADKQQWLSHLFLAHISGRIAFGHAGFAFVRSFGGDNVPFHDFTTFVTRHLVSLARAVGRAVATRELLRDRPPGLRQLPLSPSLQTARSSKVYWVRRRVGLICSRGC